MRYYNPDPEQTEGTVTISYCRLVKETDLARQYDMSDDPFSPDRHWIPKSQIIEDDEESITIPEWLAAEKGLL